VFTYFVVLTQSAAEMCPIYPVLMESLANITNIRGTTIDGNHHEAFLFFFDALIPAVAGCKIWMPWEQSARLILESKKVVPVLDEAYTILALENY
jgi:hypothetical protein